MSKLDELICEFCSNGVETVKIKNAFQRLKGTPITAARMKEINNPEGEIKVFAGGKTVITAKEKDIPNANIIRVPAVLVQSRGVIDVIYYDKPFTFKNEMWAYTTSDSTTVKYLFYVLKNNVQRFRDAASGMGSLPQISLPVTEEFEIPLPPIEVQSEIVRILDDYTENVVELQNQLALEITARQRQYTFYRNKLLTYDSKTRIMPLKDVAEIERGTRVVRSQLTEAGLYPVFQNALTPMGYNDKANRLGNNTFLICAGAAGQIGYSDVDFWAADDCYTFKCCEKLENRYLFHVLKNNQHRIDAQVRRASIPRISREAVGNIRIPIPPLDVQNRIVNVLDNFEKICSDLNIGLPAEIEARQKQYEYYRDKLLTFAENGNTILSRAEQSRAEQSRAEQSRAEQSRAEQSRAEQSRAEQSRAEH